jgi:hypothetical protein
MEIASESRIAEGNAVGTGTVSNILDEWKRAVQGSDYESVREWAIHCKKEGINLADLSYISPDPFYTDGWIDWKNAATHD